jgi:hypothetical protein
MGGDAGLSRRLGLGSRRGRWRPVASLGEGPMVAYERLVRAGVADFSVSANALDLEKIYRHRGFWAGPVCVRCALLHCWENRVEGGNLKFPRKPKRFLSMPG